MLSPSSFGSGVHRGRWLVLLTTTTACMFGSAAMASAATFTVNSTTDAALSNPASTACPATCSLREAVQAADNTGGANTITLPAGDYKYSLPDTASGQTDNPEVGDLDVNAGVSLTINGAGASSTTIDPNFIDRAFAVQSGGSLAISGVTIQHGSQTGNSTGYDSVASYYGGAIYNDGVLSISNSVLSNNASDDGGGVVYADDDATSTSISDTTVTGNSSDDEGAVAQVDSGSVTFSGDTFTHNSGDDDGGVLYDYENGNTVGPVTITNSTLSSNFTDGDGGALYLEDAGALSITSSTVNDNSSDYDDGGAIDDEESGTITISGSTLSGNTTDDDDGGMLYAYETGPTTITNSTIDNDESGDDYGGALYLDDTDLTVSGSTFTNDEGYEGGAVYLDGSTATATESITTSSFTSDTASEYGGAIYDDEGDLSVTRSTFTGNDSYDGGAFYYDSGDGLSLTNDTIDSNQAQYGGGVYLDTTAGTGTVSLLNDTIARNTAYYGGGIYEPQDANTIENTIVAGNNASSSTDGGGDCYGSAATDNAASADIGGNIDSDGSCFSSTVAGDHVGVNPDLGTLASNGGAMQTDAPLTGSPAIGAAVSGTCPSTDERGVTRPAACDSGAFQTAAAALSITNSGPSSATVGNPITYTLTVTNGGPGAATGVTVTDTLPSNVTYFGSTTSQGSCSGTTTITCSLGTIDSTETGTSNTATITITVIPTAAGSISNSAVVGSSIGGTMTTSGSAVAAATTVAPAAAAAGTTVTLAIKPVTATGVASKIKSTRAYLAALVNPAGRATTYTIQVRRAGTSKWVNAKKVRNLAARTAVYNVAMTAQGLEAGKKYSYRVTATSSIGTSYGQVRTFTTKKAAKAKKK